MDSKLPERSEAARMSAFGERLAVLENSVSGKNGVIDQLTHAHECIERLKATVWKATGAAAALFLFVKFVIGI